MGHIDQFLTEGVKICYCKTPPVSLFGLQPPHNEGAKGAATYRINNIFLYEVGGEIC